METIIWRAHFEEQRQIEEWWEEHERSKPRPLTWMEIQDNGERIERERQARQAKLEAIQYAEVRRRWEDAVQQRMEERARVRDMELRKQQERRTWRRLEEDRARDPERAKWVEEEYKEVARLHRVYLGLEAPIMGGTQPVPAAPLEGEGNELHSPRTLEFLYGAPPVLPVAAPAPALVPPVLPAPPIYAAPPLPVATAPAVAYDFAPVPVPALVAPVVPAPAPVPAFVVPAFHVPVFESPASGFVPAVVTDADTDALADLLASTSYKYGFQVAFPHAYVYARQVNARLAMGGSLFRGPSVGSTPIFERAYPHTYVYARTDGARLVPRTRARPLHEFELARRADEAEDERVEADDRQFEDEFLDLLAGDAYPTPGGDQAKKGGSAVPAVRQGGGVEGEAKSASGWVLEVAGTLGDGCHTPREGYREFRSWGLQGDSGIAGTRHGEDVKNFRVRLYKS